MMKLSKISGNQMTEFILMGITKHPGLQGPLFVVFLLKYMAISLGNLGIIILTSVDTNLHTPMYFFLNHLAFVDLGYSTVVGPKTLVGFIMEKNTITYIGCAIELVFFVIFITSELFILSAMAYDCYVAICKPLRYMVIVSDRTCWILVTISYFYSILVSLLVTIKIFKPSFCKLNVIRHFYCDGLPLFSIICSEKTDIELIIMILATFNLVSSLLIILISFMLILVATFRMNSAEGRHKAFSTCGSHITGMVIFCGTLLFMYLQPQSSHYFDIAKITSFFYTLVIPMLNPLIHRLRNKEMKNASKSLFKIIYKHPL
ncbi:olfactory receptor 8K3-like [Vombatus ursinus]|uniref:olfactory receptor 8K3-like n=1 Tax=Vombatus ursinus TaxID=29139 RepID=UPI000FFD86ED|nr:olfactory receptor 8K3-like [Vombatus ursinus]